MQVITEFLGWCTVINYGVLIFSTLMITTVGDWAKEIHSKLFKISKEKLDAMYFNFLANYKLAIFIFNLAPYIALKIMA
ncbi:hypothetical protein N8303_05660 [Gammaproteobacteria bacterium]|jgi:hypothetical protein|nr:hypothetical protein [Gammaproteobacteria bacterium]